MKPRKSRIKRVALFGGSFNPPHEGHREIVRRLAARKSIDEVWILPVWRHPFRKKLPSFKKRVAACRKYFLIRKTKVKRFEKHRGTTGRTIDLLLYLTQKFPHYRFSWAMGEDTYRQRKRWKDFQKVRQLAQLLIFPRGPDSPIPNLSSREIRRSRA